MFFEDRDGNLYPLSRVTKVYMPSDGWVRIDLIDGDAVYSRPFILQKFKDSSSAIVSAAPGTHILLFSNEEGDDEIFRRPVIAWQLIGSGELIPITCEDQRDGGFDSDDFVIEHPGGRVTQAGVGVWESAEAYLKSFKPNLATAE